MYRRSRPPNNRIGQARYSEFDTEEFAAKNRESEAPNRLNRDRKSNTPPPKRRGGGKGPTTVGPPNAGDADKKQSSEASYSGVPIDLCYGASYKRHLHHGSGLQTRVPNVMLPGASLPRNWSIATKWQIPQTRNPKTLQTENWAEETLNWG